jgi:hypothetical protein
MIPLDSFNYMLAKTDELKILSTQQKQQLLNAVFPTPTWKESQVTLWPILREKRRKYKN